METDLFRKEVIAEQSQRLTGSVILAQPLSITIATLIIVAIVASSLMFISSAHYSRKETVQGYLRPDKGLIKSYSNRTGTIKKIYISEGDFVEKGSPLVSIVTRQSMSTGEELGDKLIEEINIQQDLLVEEAEQYLRIESQELSRITQRINILENSQTIIKNQKALLNEKLQLLEQQQIQYTKLHDKGFISELEFQKKQENHLNIRQEVESLERVLLLQQYDIQQLAFEYKNIPEQYQLKHRDIKRRQSDLSRQFSETKNNYNYVIEATHSGVVTAIQVVEGETLNSTRLLLTLLPQGAELIAELLLPTRSAGFVQIGDIARLRFQAFPHQRFGYLKSKITQIDQSIITQSEANFPIQLTEPIYRLQARLSKQQITGYGKEFNLKSGMLFEADIILDRRTLLQWMLDPIYSLNGKIN
ncbi:toxin secretion protein [Alteromonadales bacterium alter-6D02]|nr:toxin secretion protein [Alteromonadales bacterium alter-6D02]